MLQDTISPKQYQRSQRLQRSTRWTDEIHRLYPPCGREPAVIAVVYDPAYHGGRWGLAYDRSALMPSAGGLATVRYLHLFYYWQGEGDAYLDPSPRMADWLRDHDMWSSTHAGEWEDRMFGAEERMQADRLRSETDDYDYEAREIRRRFKLEEPSKPRPRLSDKYWGGVQARERGDSGRIVVARA